mmetsp:Transcript_31685/g.71248  ORF Transcript_31685/g.71248 Transcript_31685/m.71248 type:complete len:504 (+) Transcript_31685:301-1812(+)
MPTIYLPDLATCAYFLSAVWIGFEVLFYSVVVVDWKRGLEVLRRAPPPRLDPEELIDRILDDVEAVKDYDVTKFLSGWFLGADLVQVKRGNAEEFLGWAMYNATRKELSQSPERRAAVGRVLGEIRRRFGVEFEAGLNPEVKCSNFTLQPSSVHVGHRPLLFYACVAVAKYSASMCLFQAGFVPYKCGPMSYWYRPCCGRPAGSPEPLPMVFFHGISPGLCIYIPMLKNLCQGRAALLVELPHVGMGMDLAPPSREQTVKAVLRALKRHRIRRCCVAGHSYGSFCAAWMVHEAKHVVAQLVLLDPMCLLLALPDVTFNFLYRQPKTATQRLIHWFAASEMGVNNTLRRHFWWYNSCLFAHEIIDLPTVVHLASNDSIAPAKHIRGYLEVHFGARIHTTDCGSTVPESKQASGSPRRTLSLAANSSTSSLSSASSSSSSSSSTGKGCPSSTLELIWSEGFDHGEVVCDTKRQHEIAQRMYIQECRIFAEEEKFASDRSSSEESP